MDRTKTVDVLNTFISINNKREKKYESAFIETDDPDLKNLFKSFLKKNEKYKELLISEVEKLGGEPALATERATFQFLKIWLRLKSKYSLKDREEILNCCEYDEDVFIKTYRNILINNFQYLTLKQLDILKVQLQSISINHDILKNLGDRLLMLPKKLT